MRTTDNHGKHRRTWDVSLPSKTQEVPPRTAPIDPMTVAPRWALCPLGWQAHAIDTWADHPPGVWIARCGHQLSGGTPLYDVPQGHPCPSCARWSTTTNPGTSS